MLHTNDLKIVLNTLYALERNYEFYLLLKMNIYCAAGDITEKSL
jgi:hypothetical protein